MTLTYTGDDVLTNVPLISGCADENVAKKFTLSKRDGVNIGYQQQSDGTWAAVAAATLLTEQVTSFTEGTVYSISTKAELARLATLVNAKKGGKGSFFALTRDIDLAGNAGDPWTVIGSEDHPFAGTFDGRGHTVKGLYINTPQGRNQGLFGGVGVDGIVRALTVAGQVTADLDSGGVVGENFGLVERCISEVTVTGRQAMGGIVGWNYEAGNVDTKGCVRACVNKGKVSVAGNKVGGIVGANMGEIVDCANAGAVSGSATSTFVGGIAGDNRDGSMMRCISLGSVTGYRDVGGIVGLSDRDSTVSACVVLGLSVRADADSGRIAGPETDGTLSGNFVRADMTLTGGTVTAATPTQTGIHGESISLTGDWQKTTFAGWDFANTWTEGERNTLPTLRGVGGSLSLPAQPASGGGSSSSGSSNSKPIVTAGEGGGVKADGKGNVTITPDEGYRITTITVNGKAVAVPENGVLTGLKSWDKVVVTFEPIPAAHLYTPEQFTDLDPDAWYGDGVTYVLEKGLFRGTSETVFSPNAPGHALHRASSNQRGRGNGSRGNSMVRLRPHMGRGERDQ